MGGTAHIGANQIYVGKFYGKGLDLRIPRNQRFHGLKSIRTCTNQTWIFPTVANFGPESLKFCDSNTTLGQIWSR